VPTGRAIRLRGATAAGSTLQKLEMADAARRFAGGAPHQFRGLVAQALPVDFFAQPFPQRPIFSPCQLRFEGRQVERGLAHELRRVEVAERVGREISQHSHAPVIVLQAAVGVLCHFQAEHFFKFLIPTGRHVRHGQPPFDEFHLDFKPQEDVQIIRDLVRLHADERG